MAKQDDWVRLTVRMPPSLYERLQAIVASGPLSMNAEIVDRLEQSLEAPPRTAGGLPLTDEGLETMLSLAADTRRVVEEFKRELNRAEEMLLSREEQDREARERTKPKPE